MIKYLVIGVKANPFLSCIMNGKPCNEDPGMIKVVYHAAERMTSDTIFNKSNC